MEQKAIERRRAEELFHAQRVEAAQAVVAVVVRSDPTLTEMQVSGPLSESLAKFKQPKQVIFLPELPRNTMGKVQKKALRESYAELFS